MSDWFNNLLGVDPEKAKALNEALHPATLEEQRQAHYGQEYKRLDPRLAGLSDREAARQYIEANIPEADRTAAAQEAGLPIGGMIRSFGRGVADAFNPSFEPDAPVVGEGPYDRYAHMGGNLGGYAAQFAMLPKAAATIVGKAAQFAPRLEPLIAKAPRAIAAALDLGTRAELGAAAGHRGIAATAEATGRPIDPTADFIATGGGAIMQSLPLGYGGGTGLAGRLRSGLVNTAVGELGLGGMGAANSIQQGGSGLEGAKATLSDPKMQILPALAGVAGFSARPEPFHFSRNQLTPEQLAALSAPKAQVQLTPEQLDVQRTARTAREEAARAMLAGKRPASTSVTAPLEAPGPTGIPPTPHPAAVPSAAAAKGPVQGSTSVLGGQPAPAPPPGPVKPGSLVDFQPDPALAALSPRGIVDATAAQRAKQHLATIGALLDLEGFTPGSKAYFDNGVLSTTVPPHIGEGPMHITGTVKGPNGHWLRVGDSDRLIEAKPTFLQEQQTITLPDQKKLHLPKGYQPIQGGRVFREPVDPRHQNLGVGQVVDIYGEKMDDPSMLLVHSPDTNQAHLVPKAAVPGYQAKLDAIKASEEAEIARNGRGATVNATLDQTNRPIDFRDIDMRQIIESIVANLPKVPE